MSKKHLVILLAGILVVAGCFIFVLNRASQLPSNVALPSTKPASAQPSDRTAVSVSAASVQQDVVLANSSKPAAKVAAAPTPVAKTAVTNCDQTKTAKSMQAAGLPMTPVSSVLDSVISATPLANKLSL